MQTDIKALRERAEAEGQGHLFAFWDELGPAERERLAREVAGLDFDLLREQRALLQAPPASDTAPQFDPPELFPLERGGREDEVAEARRQGEVMLREGLVGYVLVAGGQGSRLGFEGPKGKFPVGPVTGRSLFEWHARRLRQAQERYGKQPVWYIMTSGANDAETRAFFEAHEHFGLGAENVRFFQQAMIPALDLEGRIMLQSKSELFLAPNGHGGTLAALASSGSLRDAQERGVECFSYFQVDSPLARPVDPLFLGLHGLEGAVMSTKVVSKRDPEEKVGVIGKSGGKLGCIEYSDLPDELRFAKDDEGRLLFGAGNIAMHLLERRFVEELTSGELDLPWHLAHKRMTVVGADGQMVEREGVKFETFIFDALGHAERSITLEVDRRHEFSPVKNAEGADSPTTTRRDLTQLFAQWVAAAGLEPPPIGPDGYPMLEVDPVLAEDEETFLARGPHEPEITDKGHLYR